MTEVFADTFFFIALLNSHDPAHDRAKTQSNGHPRLLVTTAWVLTELGDAFAGTPERMVPGILKRFSRRTEFRYRTALRVSL